MATGGGVPAGVRFPLFLNRGGAKRMVKIKEKW